MTFCNTSHSAVTLDSNIVVVASTDVLVCVAALWALSEYAARVMLLTTAGQSHPLSLGTRAPCELWMCLGVCKMPHEMLQQLRNSSDRNPTTDVRLAAVVVVQTGDVCLTNHPLVTLIHAVKHLVTESIPRYTLAGLTLPFRFAADRRTAALLVGTVVTLPNSVAQEVAQNAPVVVAAHVTRFARPLRVADVRNLVGFVQTVGHSIAPPRPWYADPVTTPPLVLTTAVHVLLTVRFVRSIDAIAFTITHPIARKAGSSAGAAEVSRIRTRKRRAVAQLRAELLHNFGSSSEWSEHWAIPSQTTVFLRHRPSL